MPRRPHRVVSTVRDALERLRVRTLHNRESIRLQVRNSTPVTHDQLVGMLIALDWYDGDSTYDATIAALVETAGGD